MDQQVTVNKHQLAREAVRRTIDIDPKITPAIAELIIGATFTVIRDHVGLDHVISITEFGKFSTALREPRMARNPKTGEPVQVGQKKVVRFKPAKNLKEWVQSTL
jgi:integration host factor subunit beta